MNSITAAVGELLYNNRTENELSEKEMALKCNISECDYISFENGSMAIPLHTFIEISQLCDIDIISFFKKHIPANNSYDNADISYLSETGSFKNEDGKNYTAYNILVKRNNIIMTRFSDVFFNKEAAMHFVDMCNRLNLDPLHVADVIDDVIIS